MISCFMVGSGPFQSEYLRLKYMVFVSWYFLQKGYLRTFFTKHSRATVVVGFQTLRLPSGDMVNLSSNGHSIIALWVGMQLYQSGFMECFHASEECPLLNYLYEMSSHALPLVDFSKRFGGHGDRDIFPTGSLINLDGWREVTLHLFNLR